MATAQRKEADRRMAAYLKERHEVRTTCRCPACHRVIGLAALPAHLQSGCNAWRTARSEAA